MKKTALCVGINNYPGTGSDLAGCVNDAATWQAVATLHGFSVTKLIDSQATRANILEHLRPLVLNAEQGDSLLFTFSGHGTQVPDTSGDEPDRMDEALCCHDCYEGGLLLDDELWQLFRQKQSGVQLVMISDSCHSGTVARKIGAPIRVQQSQAQRKYLPHQLLRKEALRALPPVSESPHRLAEEGGWLKGAKGAAKVPWPLLLLAGCQDHEYSYDAIIDRQPCGALTCFAARALGQLPPGVTYNEWFLELRKQLPSSSYPQTPRVIGSYLKKPVFS